MFALFTLYNRYIHSVEEMIWFLGVDIAMTSGNLWQCCLKRNPEVEKAHKHTAGCILLACLLDYSPTRKRFYHVPSQDAVHGAPARLNYGLLLWNHTQSVPCNADEHQNSHKCNLIGFSIIYRTSVLSKITKYKNTSAHHDIIWATKYAPALYCASIDTINMKRLRLERSDTTLEAAVFSKMCSRTS